MAGPASDRAAQPRILGKTIEITGYPLTMVLAEKIVTMMQRGTANTRWRDDFFDVCTLTHQHQHPLNDDELRESMSTVANHRQAGLVPLEETLVGSPLLASRSPLPAQPKWVAWRRRRRLEDRLTENFADVLTASVFSPIRPSPTRARTSPGDRKP